ncbi:hypothetical protein [Longitalea luteola]|uniref:hypothetical protein n=1 Tax=Longitalea luteola TaxID=2812563 RepID=UPI001A962500|nr:hypothetical protein [Longitalea luteola]
MKRFVVVLLVLPFLINCTPDEKEKAKETKQKTSTTKTKTANKDKAKTTTAAKAAPKSKLDFIQSIPGSIDGCGEFFTYDTVKLSDEKYIFLSDMGEMAIIRIKGKDVQLKKSLRESKQINATNSVEVYYAVGYKVVLRKKEVKMVDQLYEYSGILQITGKKLKVTYKVRGEGGC